MKQVDPSEDQCTGEVIKSDVQVLAQDGQIVEGSTSERDFAEEWWWVILIRRFQAAENPLPLGAESRLMTAATPQMAPRGPRSLSV